MRLEDEAQAPSPSLLIFPDRVDENLRRMIAIVGDPARLRPHIKTHKLPQIVARQVELGITKCKAATIAEAEMAARAGAVDILVAAQLVGRPRLAGIIAGRGEAAAQLAVRLFEPADVVSLPAVEGDRHGGEPLEGRIRVDAEIGVAPLGERVSDQNVVSHTPL